MKKVQTTEEAALLRCIRQDPQEGVTQLLSLYGGMLRALVRHVLSDPRDVEECVWQMYWSSVGVRPIHFWQSGIT